MKAADATHLHDDGGSTRRGERVGPMTRLFNEPAAFADEMLDGFVAAHATWCVECPAASCAAPAAPAGKVAVVIGGGSGHYPAFAGLVGPGMADGAAMGNIFASPSARQVCSVAKAAASRGAGVLLCFGNYAGDVLHFGQAADLLERATAFAAVTLRRHRRHLQRAPPTRSSKRRGIAGDLAVFKVAAAAADAGLSLDEVHRVAAHANDRTRSLGVAFSGCTLPGADKPLFTVPAGRMAVGMGVHGEPGTSETAVPSADGLAELLVTTSCATFPADVADVRGARVGLILNGLGTVKYEELYVVYRRIAQLLQGEGIVTVEPEVGEFVTSYDMAGVSLTLFWLDDELEAYWKAPAHSPAYRKGDLAAAGSTAAAHAEPVTTSTPAQAEQHEPPAGEASRDAARTVLSALTAIRDTIDDNVEALGDIDAVAGDGDHGIGMQRGAHAAVDAAAAARGPWRGGRVGARGRRRRLGRPRRRNVRGALGIGPARPRQRDR